MTVPWHTPSPLPLDDASHAAVARGKSLHHLQVLIAAIRDPRLGTCPIAIQLLAEVIACADGQATAYPGLTWLHEQIARHRRGLQTRLSKGGVRNASALLSACGYIVSEQRGRGGRGRAVAHYVATLPDADEREAAITAWCREQQGPRHAGRDTSGGSYHPYDDISDEGSCHAGDDASASGVMPGMHLVSRPACNPPTPLYKAELVQRNLKSPPTPQAAPGGRRPQSTYLSRDWRPTEADRAWAIEEAPNMAGQLEAVTGAFVDRCSGKRHSDWPALWRTAWRDAVREHGREDRAAAAEARRAATATGGPSWAARGHRAASAATTPVVVDAAAVQRNRAYAAMMGYRPGSPVRDHGTDYEMPRRYLPSTPEAQAYIASAERDGEPQEDIARYRQRGVMLRPSEARRVLAGGAAGSQQIGATSRLIVARAASERSTAEAMA